MIRSWIAIVALSVGIPVAQGAEELPVPNVRAADVPAPPLPQLPALQMPLPDIGEPAKPVDAKPEQPQPAEPPKVVAPSTLLPNSAFPQPAPSIIVPGNPNPRGTVSNGTVSNGTTPSLPSEATLAPANTPSNNVPNELKWRYKWHNGQWWYWSPDELWMIWDQNSWSVYDAATYQAPAGFAKPGPRVVTQQSMTATLPENYSSTEISVPESYYLTPAPTYVQPTPYAFGVDSYYGPYGPAAGYYNRRSRVSLSISTPAYVPLYEGYLAPQYFGPRYTAPVGGYPGYGVPGYYGGRGVTIGFGF